LTAITAGECKFGHLISFILLSEVSRILLKRFE
jgi:hypothetical protein